MVNQVLVLSACSWALAQVLKFLLSAITNRKFEVVCPAPILLLSAPVLPVPLF